MSVMDRIEASPAPVIAVWCVPIGERMGLAKGMTGGGRARVSCPRRSGSCRA